MSASGSTLMLMHHLPVDGCLNLPRQQRGHQFEVLIGPFKTTYLDRFFAVLFEVPRNRFEHLSLNTIAAGLPAAAP
jgi:hypothetical protein